MISVVELSVPMLILVLMLIRNNNVAEEEDVLISAIELIVLC